MKAVLAPKINATGVHGFLLWARRDNPGLYAAMVRGLPEVAAFDAALRDNGLGAFSLSGAIKSLSGSAKRVAGFVADNALKVATVALPLVVAKKEADIAKAQVKLAQLQAAPMQTAYVAGGPMPVPVVSQGGRWTEVPTEGGIVGASVALPGGLSWKLIAGAGGALLLIALLSRR